MSWSRAQVEAEVSFRTSRSGGPGGQNVNKTESKVEVVFDIGRSTALNEGQKELLISRLSNRINRSGELLASSSSARSQLRNKQIALDRLFTIIEEGLHIQKARKRTRPSKAAIRKRLEGKTKRSETKQQRNWKINRD